MRRTCGVLSTLMLLGIAATAGLTPPASAKTRVVVSPKPGATVQGNTLRIVVRAGDEYGDLSVKLNGREIGPEFPYGKRGLRALRASVSHGLRRGRNVLSVRARRGLKTRRATVRFRVTRRAHLVGAGRNRLVTVGTTVPIAHRIVAPTGKRAASPRVRVVRAPRGSRVRGLAALTPAKPAGPRALRAATLPMTPLKPALNPDVPGPYTVRVTVGSGKSAVTDTVTHEARPKDPLIPVDTSVSVDGRPAISLAGTSYPAPFMGADDAGKGNYRQGNGPFNGGGYQAQWHVMAVSRANTSVLWERTYGACYVDNPPFYYECRAPDDRPAGAAYSPVSVNSKEEVAALTPGNGQAGALIIATSLPGADDQFVEDFGFLKSIGYAIAPRGNFDKGADAFHSVIGVPGMKHGGADMSPRGDVGGLRGFLTPDQTYKYHFLRAARPHFDTRSTPETACPADAASCTVTQTVDGHTVSGMVEKGHGGYLVSSWDPTTLQPRGSKFVTIDSDSSASQDGTATLLDYLQKLNDDGSVIVITTLHTPGMNPGTLIGGPPEKWNAVTDLIASIGGTKNGFLKAVSTPGADYTLIGWGGAGENGGNEAGGAGDPARLRGALLTDNHGYFVRPANVSSIGSPAERLNVLMVTPTKSSWKYPDASTAEGEAIACIGAHLRKGIDIRAIYRDLLTASDATGLHGAVQEVKLAQLAAVPGTSLTCKPTQQEFEDGKAQLLNELVLVANVRGYLTALTAPETAKGELVFGQALELGNELKDALDEEAEQKEVISAALGFVATILDIIAPGVGSFVKEAEKVSHAIEATAGAFELASRAIERDSAGAQSEDSRVAAVELATDLQIKAAAAVAAFTQIGDVIVSDPEKLAEVGLNQRCPADAPGGCAEGMEEYAATGEDLADLTDVALRGMGREIYSKLVPKMYTTWDTGLTAFPDDPYSHFGCTGTSSPFGKVPADQYAASLERVNYGAPPLSRVYLSIRSATTWHWIPKNISDRMFGTTADDWDKGGLGMDRLSYLRDMPERFEPGSYSCAFDK